MFWRVIKNAKLLRNPELVLPFCLRLEAQKTHPHLEAGGARSTLEYRPGRTPEGGEPLSAQNPNGG